MSVQFLQLEKILFVLLISVVLVKTAAAAESTGASQPSIRDLGGNRYQVGQIIIDKNTGQFRVPGKVIRTEPPLEFLAVTKGGHKAYESYLELDGNAIEFNLACILIGLDSEKTKSARFHFDPVELEGDRVEMQIEWLQDGKTVTMTAAELLLEGSKEPRHPTSDWVYLGSGFSPSGLYLAELSGVLVSFVHDPTSVIEHRTGVGLRKYGAVAISKNAPPLDTPIVYIVRKVGD